MFLAALVAASILRSSVLAVDTTSSGQSPRDWSGWGGNICNNRWASQNHDLSTANINSLASHCNITYPLGVSATPVVSGDVTYFPTWNGSFVALHYRTCNVLWQINVSAIVYDYAPPTALQAEVILPVSRTSPQIDGDVLFFGTQMHALIVAVERSTGMLLGVQQTNSHPLALVTMSPTFYDGRLFIGVSSQEEFAANNSTYKCCSFVGNILALKFDLGSKSFNVLWNIDMIPQAQAAQGWAGVGVWGSQPSIDKARGQVFIATGNTYSIPAVILECQTATANITAVVEGLVPDPCLPTDILQESIIAIDIDLGIINWIHQFSALDAWTVACGLPGLSTRNSTLCPQTPGLDADFGMAPAFVPGSSYTPYGKDIVVAGQKNGNLYALSAEAGHLFWTTVTSPDGTSGGLSWGIAVDDQRVYFTAINSREVTWQLQPSKQSIHTSAYGAASLATGDLIWETASPDDGVAVGPPSVVGDLVVVARSASDQYFATKGSLLALAKGSGSIVGEWPVDAAIQGGVAVQDKIVMFGSGYDYQRTGMGSFNVFSVAGP